MRTSLPIQRLCCRSARTTSPLPSPYHCPGRACVRVPGRSCRTILQFLASSLPFLPARHHRHPTGPHLLPATRRLWHVATCRFRLADIRVSFGFLCGDGCEAVLHRRGLGRVDAVITSPRLLVTVTRPPSRASSGLSTFTFPPVIVAGRDADSAVADAEGAVGVNAIVVGGDGDRTGIDKRKAPALMPLSAAVSSSEPPRQERPWCPREHRRPPPRGAYHP